MALICVSWDTIWFLSIYIILGLTLASYMQSSSWFVCYPQGSSGHLWGWWDLAESSTCEGIFIRDAYYQSDTVTSYYNMVNILQNIQDRHPVAQLRGRWRDIFCKFEVRNPFHERFCAGNSNLMENSYWWNLISGHQLLTSCCTARLS